MADDVRAWLAEYNAEALLADGFEGAVLGVGERCGQPAVVVYDVERCLAILQARDGLTPEAAAEYFDFNVAGAWMGAGTPIWLTRWRGAGAA